MVDPQQFMSFSQQSLIPLCFRFPIMSCRSIQLRSSASAVAGPSRFSLSRTVLANAKSLRPVASHPRDQLLPSLTRSLCTSHCRHSGHNRWSKIRHKKGALDAQRSALFSRLTNVCPSPPPCSSSELIYVQDLLLALRPPNSPDPLVNQRLALAVSKAKEGGVTKAAIEGIFARARPRYKL